MWADIWLNENISLVRNSVRLKAKRCSESLLLERHMNNLFNYFDTVKWIRFALSCPCVCVCVCVCDTDRENVGFPSPYICECWGVINYKKRVVEHFKQYNGVKGCHKSSSTLWWSLTIFPLLCFQTDSSVFSKDFYIPLWSDTFLKSIQICIH